MAKLPSSFRSKNRTTRDFRLLFAKLPTSIQLLIREACRLFDENPAHPSLRIHELVDTKKGHHYPGSVSVSITMQYRAIYIPVDGINVWYWIGSHAAYETYTGRK